MVWYEEVKKLSFETGGTLGLFTGMSFLSMAEMLYWLTKIPLAIFKKWNQNSNNVKCLTYA